LIGALAFYNAPQLSDAVKYCLDDSRQNGARRRFLIWPGLKELIHFSAFSNIVAVAIPSLGDPILTAPNSLTNSKSQSFNSIQQFVLSAPFQTPQQAAFS
jgi:hypothetical protein